MQKIEKWRIQEMAQALNHLSQLLRLGENSEWANVFSHFAKEAQNLVDQRMFKLDVLKRLSQNIINCFDSTSSLRNLVLTQKNNKKMEILNQEFRETIRMLFEILAAMEKKWTESVN